MEISLSVSLLCPYMDMFVSVCVPFMLIYGDICICLPVCPFYACVRFVCTTCHDDTFKINLLGLPKKKFVLEKKHHIHDINSPSQRGPRRLPRLFAAKQQSYLDQGMRNRAGQVQIRYRLCRGGNLIMSKTVTFLMTRIEKHHK